LAVLPHRAAFLTGNRTVLLISFGGMPRHPARRARSPEGWGGEAAIASICDIDPDRSSRIDRIASLAVASRASPRRSGIFL